MKVSAWGIWGVQNDRVLFSIIRPRPSHHPLAQRVGNSKLVITRWRQPLAGRQQSRLLLFDFATSSPLSFLLPLTLALAYPFYLSCCVLSLTCSFLSFYTSQPSLSFSSFSVYLFLSLSPSWARVLVVLCALTWHVGWLCAMRNALVHRIRGLSLWWPTQCAAAGTKAATEIRAELSTTIVPSTWIPTYAVLRLLLLFFFIFSREDARERRRTNPPSLAIPAGCNRCYSTVSPALVRHGAYASSGKTDGEGVGRPRSWLIICKYEVFHHGILQIAKSHSVNASEKSANNVDAAQNRIPPDDRIYSSYALTIRLNINIGARCVSAPAW